MDNRFKILSLDGGGIRGYLSLLILADIEDFLNIKNHDTKAIGERPGSYQGVPYPLWS